MKITLNEVLTSLTLIAIFLGLGTIIENNINSRDKELRVTIDTPGEFDYAIRTGLGYFIAEDTLWAKDPVMIPDLIGKYMMIRKIKEVYTEKTQLVSYKDSDGNTHYRTETYWEWEVKGEEKFQAHDLRFLEKHINIEIPSPKYQETKKVKSDLRYIYKTTPLKVPGTLCGEIPEKGVLKNLHFWGSRKIEDIEKNRDPETTFWILWAIFIIGAVVFYWSRDNEWLET